MYTHIHIVCIYIYTHIHTYRIIQIDALLGKYIHLLIYIQGRSVHFGEVHNKVISGKTYWGTTASSTTFGEGNGTPLQYSHLENSMDGGAW